MSSISGPRYSFQITDATAFYSAMVEAIGEYLEDDENTRRAVTAAMFAWHLCDWVWKTYYRGEGVASLEFQLFLWAECPRLEHMQEITNGSKHLELTKKQPSVTSTELHGGAFSSAFSSAFDIGGLRLILDDGTPRYFSEEIKVVRGYWTQFFREMLHVAV